MTEKEVIDLMASSMSEDQWNSNCDKVKAAFGGHYPDFWYELIIRSGLLRLIAVRWGGDDQIHVIGRRLR